MRDQDQARHARAEQLLAQARTSTGGAGAGVSTSQQAVLDAASSRLDSAVSNVSDQGKALLAQNAQTPAMKAPGPDKIVPASEVTITDVAGAKPAPMKATPLAKPVSEAEKTVITSTGAAYFDSKQAMGVFTDDVVVQHPQFHITCDVLEVYMRKEGEAAPAPAPRRDPQTPPPLPGESPRNDGLGDSGVERAIAKGRKVVIQKLSETGDIQIGICRHATYDGASGDIIMRDYPQVQRGRNVVIATDSSTVMTIKPNGELKTAGPTRVDLLPSDGKDKKKDNQTPASASVNPQ